MYFQAFKVEGPTNCPANQTGYDEEAKRDTS